MYAANNYDPSPTKENVTKQYIWMDTTQKYESYVYKVNFKCRWHLQNYIMSLTSHRAISKKT